MNAQATKLQAVENDLKNLMAEVTRAMEKAQEAVARIASKAATATDFVHAQDGAFKKRSDDLIALAAVPKHEGEGRVPFIVVEFQQLLAYRGLAEAWAVQAAHNSVVDSRRIMARARRPAGGD